MTVSDKAHLAGAAAYWPDRDMAFDHDHCFLCGTELSDSNRTDEHVFPKWLQRRFDLWNAELTLLNGTHIRYSRLTIPCCKECNTYWLSRVEAIVAPAFAAGPAAVAALDKTTLCLWMAKIYYGIHFKEIALPADRREPDLGAIIDRDYLARFAELHHVLQAMRKKVLFRRVPGSVFVYSCQVPPDSRFQFDYRDSHVSPFLALRAGDTVIMASLLDWEAFSQEIDAPRLNAAASITLHPFQFAEVAATGAYISAKFNRTFAYLLNPDGDQDRIEPIIVFTAEAPADSPIFLPLDTKEWAAVLAEMLFREVGDVYDADNDAVWTTLLKPDGSPNYMPLGEIPYPEVDIRPNWALSVRSPDSPATDDSRDPNS